MDKQEYIAAGMSPEDAEVAAAQDAGITLQSSPDAAQIASGGSDASFDPLAEIEHAEGSDDKPSVSASSEELALLRAHVDELGLYVMRILKHLDPSGLSRSLHPVSKIDGEPL